MTAAPGSSRRRPGPGRVLHPAVLVALLAPVSASSQQTSFRAPAGLIAGAVVDSATGEPVPFALVVLSGGLRVFANEAGRFSLRAGEGGARQLRIQQIGYTPVTLSLQVDVTAAGTEPGPPLSVALARRPFVLPDITVDGSGCAARGQDAGGESAELLALAFENAERVYTLESAYPIRSVFIKEVKVMDTMRVTMLSRSDTIQARSDRRLEYRPGMVIQRRKAGGKGAGREVATYFSVADIAAGEFRENHCFWYAGRDVDSASGIAGFRIDFAPRPENRSPDWAGSLFLDSATAVLLRSEARLVNLPSEGTAFAGARCIVDYTQLAPTLVHPMRAVCAIARAAEPRTFVLQRLTLLEHAFVGRRPDGSGPARP